jgi:hypothetical protein
MKSSSSSVIHFPHLGGGERLRGLAVLEIDPTLVNLSSEFTTGEFVFLVVIKVLEVTFAIPLPKPQP